MSNKWISVKDYLPEIGEYVLVNLGTNTVLKGRRMYNGWTAFFADGEKLTGDVREVTHWQQLPISPNEVSEEDNLSKEPVGSVDEILLNKAKQLGISVDFSDKEYDGDKEAPMDRIGFLDYLINESHKSSEQCVEIAKQFTNSKLEEIETKIKSHIKWCEENIKLLTIRDAPIATEINTHPYRQFIRLLKKLK